MADTFYHFWRKIADKRPDLHSPTATVTISSEQFKKLLNAAYNAGTKDTAAVASELKGGRKSALDDLLGGLGL